MNVKYKYRLSFGYLIVKSFNLKPIIQSLNIIGIILNIGVLLFGLGNMLLNCIAMLLFILSFGLNVYDAYTKEFSALDIF